MQKASQTLAKYDNRMQKEVRPPLRLLALDGGGVRGLSEIIILKHLMRNISKNRGRNVEPWEEFDMIGGTSTGGLVAIMLGRLRMSVRDCEAAYLRLSERIFDSKRSKVNLLSRSRDFLLANGRFDSQKFEDVIKEMMKEKAMADSSVLLQDPDCKCRVFVSATRVQNSQLAVLRSYETDLPETLYDDCQVWQACRATSAAPTFFDPVTIGPYDQEFIDGGLLYNNPIQLLHREAASIWPDRINEAIYVSIGTGSAPGHSFDGCLKSIVEAMKEIVTQTEQASDDFYLAHPDIIQRNAFFRFNVFHGLADVGLEEYKEKALIADSTQSYLSLAESQQKAKSCVERLCGDARPGATLPPRELHDARRGALRDPSPDTLNWIFEEPGPGFIQWLRTGHGLFWINGKAGSGKSTLMKHIFDHHTTREILGSHFAPCIPISFFFYHLGSELQRSFEGLLRAILLEILTTIPKLAAVVIPDIKKSAWRAEVDNWTRTSLKNALGAILCQNWVVVRLCLFIDALDEYEGKASEIAEYMHLLTSMPRDRSIQVKACVSSRPHTAFEEAFRICSTLSMHQWTTRDIRHYVDISLRNHSRAQGILSDLEMKTIANLVESIVERANGVFLWVRLVVEDLYEGLCDGNTIQELQAQLEALPDHLDELYTNMMKRVDRRYLRDAEKLFQNLRSAIRPLSLYKFSEAAKHVSECFERPCGPISEEVRISESKTMLLRVASRCGGLVEVRPHESKPSHEAEVRFIHQSVEDFLSRKGVWERVFGQDLTDSTIRKARERLMAGSIRLLKSLEDRGPSLAYFDRRTCHDCISYTVEEKGPHISPTMRQLLNEMDRAYTHLYDQHCLTKSPEFPFRNWTQMSAMRFSRSHWQDTWLSFAIEAGLTWYAIAEIIADPGVVKSKQGRPLLHYAAHGQRDSRSKTPLWRDVPIIECLLDHGSDPNEVFDGLTACQVLLSDASCGEEHEIGFIPYKNVREDQVIYQWHWWLAMSLMLDYGAVVDFANEKSISIPAKVGITPSQMLLYRGFTFHEDIYNLMRATLGPFGEDWHLQPWVRSWNLQYPTSKMDMKMFGRFILSCEHPLAKRQYKSEKVVPQKRFYDC